jgi:hypothetical protein
LTLKPFDARREPSPKKDVMVERGYFGHGDN